MRASTIKYVDNIRKAAFSSKNFAAAIGLYGTYKLTRGVSKASAVNYLPSSVNKLLYGRSTDNIIASGKRGIDANVGGTSNVVKGLYSNRRKYK